MKLLLLGDHSSSHVIKWANALSDRGINVMVFSLSSDRESNKNFRDKVLIRSASFKETDIKGDNDLLKLKYLSAIRILRSIVQSYEPQILHAHYATSYGLLGVLAGFKPLIISVWGSDVFDFPHKSFIHRKILKFNLSKATRILSTSEVMAEETSIYTSKSVEVTPFGVDTSIFKASERPTSQGKELVIGTVKAMEEKYGITYLIRAFKEVKEQNPEFNLKLLLVGGGSQMEELKSLSAELEIKDKVEFTGKVNFELIPEYHNRIDIFCALSVLDSESFGVAVVEASSCENPVVVSNVGGLPEVVKNGETGLVVEKQNVDATVSALNQLIRNEDLRVKMGKSGRKRVIANYDWSKNVDQMVEIYRQTLDNIT